MLKRKNILANIVFNAKTDKNAPNNIGEYFMNTMTKISKK